MIDKLEMFIALAREGHFGKAAAACGVAQPSLSAAIKQLEAQLGVTLVIRGARYGGLTPEGQRVLVWARKIVGDAHQMRAEMRASGRGAGAGLSGDLRLAVIPTALSVAADLAARFRARHPDVRLSLLSQTSDEILSGMADLQIDAGVTYMDGAALGRMTALPLYDEHYRLVCARGSALAQHPAPPTWEDIARSRLCLLPPDMQNRKILTRSFAAQGLAPLPALESNSTVALMAQVMAGDLATILPVQLAQFLAAGRPEIVIREIADPPAAPCVGLIAVQRAPHTPVIAALLSEARRMSEQMRVGRAS